MVETVVVSGTASNGIAEQLSKILKFTLIKTEQKTLADGESYVRVTEALAGKNVILVQSTYPPQNKHLVELLLLLDAVKSLKPNKIILVIPYLAYSRQNRRFKDGEPLSVELVLKMIKDCGTDSLITVEPHKAESLDAFKGKMRIIDTVSAFVKVIPSSFKNVVVLGPDAGAADKAERFSKLIGSDFTFLNKERNKDTGEVHLKSGNEYDFSGRDVIIIDDVISTGGTVAEAADFAKANGAGRIIVIATHLIMADGCYEKLKNSSVSEVIGSNTVPNKNARIIDISDLIAEAVSSLLAAK